MKIVVVLEIEYQKVLGLTGPFAPCFFPMICTLSSAPSTLMSAGSIWSSSTDVNGIESLTKKLTIVIWSETHTKILSAIRFCLGVVANEMLNIAFT